MSKRGRLRRRESTRMRLVTLLLLISGALNIGLLSALFYVRSCPTEVLYYAWSSPALPVPEVEEHPSHIQVVRRFESYTLPLLLHKLSSTLPVEDGFAERDLALACLTALYDFDLPRALGKWPDEARELLIRGGSSHSLTSIILYPSLSEKEWDTIVRFASTERWPLAPRGLFSALCTSLEEVDSSLVNAFSFTPHYRAVARLFPSVEQDELLALMTSGSWEILEQVVGNGASELSDQARRRLLLDYLALGSHKAADLLLRLDGCEIARSGCDFQVVALLELVEEPSFEVYDFALQLLTRPRSSVVWEAAARQLYAWAGEELPEPYDHLQALARFVPEDTLDNTIVLRGDEVAYAVEERVVGIPEAEVTTYEVQKGDSLWIVALRCGCSVEELMRCNRLESETIQPGQRLTLPIP